MNMGPPKNIDFGRLLLPLLLLLALHLTTVQCQIKTMPSSKKFTLKSSDGETFEVDEAVALKSQTIKHMIEHQHEYHTTADDNDKDILSFPNITGKILYKVVEYCKEHVVVDDPKSNVTDLKKWDAEFVKVHYPTLFGIFLAAYELKIKSLSDLTSGTIGDMMKGKTPDEIRRMFNITNDCNPEQDDD